MAEVTTVEVPDIGDFTDVPVVEILVQVGQAVAAEDPLVALESDKATMEVPSPSGGVVKEILVGVDDTVSQGDPIVKLEGGDGSDEEQADVDADEQAEPEPEPESEPEPAEEDAPATSTAEAASDAPVYASPSARKLARERGIDLTKVEGSGRGGRITLEDVERGEAQATEAEPTAAVAPDTGADTEREPLTRIQRISGPRLQQWWQQIPHVTQHDEADITELEAFRKTVNAEQDVKVTILALLMKAVIASLKAYPRVNGQLDTATGAGGEPAVILHKRYHLGFAADTPGGLIVPVIHDAQGKGILELAAELRDLSTRGRDGKLRAEEMRGATFTISSLGGIGGTAFTPIINGPQVAILGVSRSDIKPVWDGEAFVPRLLLPLSFSYDHRVIDGALAARFTTHLSGVLADLRKVLL